MLDVLLAELDLLDLLLGVLEFFYDLIFSRLIAAHLACVLTSNRAAR